MQVEDLHLTGADYSMLWNYKITKFTVFVIGGGEHGERGSGGGGGEGGSGGWVELNFERSRWEGATKI